jgi:HlyD family secretion protein
MAPTHIGERGVTARTRRARVITCIAVGVLGVLPGCTRVTDEDTWHLNGRVETPLVDLAPRAMGRVIEVLVREGDRVSAGDVLVRLDLGETALAVQRDVRSVDAATARVRDLAAGSRTAEIAAADAELADRLAAADLARRELERQTFLRERQVGSARDLDRARTDVERAEAGVRAARERLAVVREGARTWQTAQARAELERAETLARQSEVVAGEAEIRAPADAVVLHRLVEPGALLAPGQPAITLGLADRLYVRTFIPQSRLGQVRQGQPMWVVVDAFPDRRFAARVTEISPTAEFTPKAVETRNERVYLVYAAKVDLDAGWAAPLVPGQPAEVFPTSASFVPAEVQP